MWFSSSITKMFSSTKASMSSCSSGGDTWTKTTITQDSDSNYIERRPMTEEEKKAFNASLKHMEDGFAKMDEAFESFDKSFDNFGKF